MRGVLALLAWTSLAWVVVAVYFAAGLWLNYVVAGHTWSLGQSLMVSVAQFWPWSVAAPVVALVAQRLPMTPPWRPLSVVAHLVVGFPVATATALAERQSRTWLFGSASELLPSHVAFDFLVYCTVVTLATFATYYREGRARELAASKTEALLHESRLRLLQAQLQPHFLFNALNTIAETVHEDPNKADEMVSHLCDLLRASLEDSGPSTSLQQELSLAEHYVAIQRARFGPRLVTSVDVPAALLSQAVPRLLLQPLLENAVQHGISPRRHGGRIWIAARRDGDSIHLEIGDDGAGCGDAGPPTEGIGLGNVRSRLQALYGTRARLDVHSPSRGGTIVTVVMPLVTA